MHGYFIDEIDYGFERMLANSETNEYISVEQSSDSLVLYEVPNDIEGEIIDDLSNLTHIKTSTIHYAIKGTLITLGILGGIPYFNRAEEFAHGNRALEGIYGYSILASSAVLSTWAFLKISKTLSNSSTKCNYGTVILASFIGICSALPITIISISYGEYIPIVVLAFVSVSIGNTLPINSGIKQMEFRFKFMNNPALNEKRHYLSNQINRAIVALGRKNPLEIYSLLKYSGIIDLLENKTHKPSLKKLSMLIKNIIGNDNPMINKPSYLMASSSIIAATIACGWLPTGYRLVFNKINSLTNNTYVAAIGSGAIVLPDYLLECMLNQELSEKIMFTLVALAQDKYKKGFAEINYPKSLSLLLLLGLLTTSFSFAPRALVVADNQDGPYTNYAMAWIIISVVYFKTSAMINLSHHLIKLFARERAEIELAALAKSIEYLESMKNYVREITNVAKLEKFYDVLKETLEEPEEQLDYQIVSSPMVQIGSRYRLFTNNDPITMSSIVGKMNSTEDYAGEFNL